MYTSSNAIVPGSISAIAQTSGKSIAEIFLGADLIAIIDTSGSMGSRDSRDNLSRYDVACNELATLQATMPGKVAVISFSDRAEFNPGGVPTFFGSGTDLARALTFSKVADVDGVRFVLISDGEPNDQQEALRVAATYKNRIDVIYVGPEDRPDGRDFLTRLAKASGGRTVTASCAKELATSVTNLLLNAG